MANQKDCPDCDAGVNRRDFLQTTGVLAGLGAFHSWGHAEQPASETYVTELYKSLSADQKKVLCFDFNHDLRKVVKNNWAITKPEIASMTKVQQDLCLKIFKGLTSEAGYEKFKQQMNDDAGGFEKYHLAIFGKPGEEKFEFVLTGRHITMRADGNSVEGAAFGGPIFYGHDPGGFNEEKDHPGNVFWEQALKVNEVYGTLNDEQKKKAVVQKAPKEDAIAFRTGDHPGLAIGAMTPDQKKIVEAAMRNLLAPYCKQDVDEVMQIITANGGLDKVHLSFYQQDEKGASVDIGEDKVWDIWRLDGPGMVWHFRGAPHVHTYVNIANV